MRSSLVQYLSDCLDRRSMFKQQLHHFHSVLLAGDVKRSETILHTVKRRKKEIRQCEVCARATLHSHTNICDCAAAFIRMIRGSKWSARKWMGGAENCQLQTTRVTKKALFSLSILLLLLKSWFLESAFLAPCVSLKSTLQNSTFVPPLLSFHSPFKPTNIFLDESFCTNYIWNKPLHFSLWRYNSTFCRRTLNVDRSWQDFIYISAIIDSPYRSESYWFLIHFCWAGCSNSLSVVIKNGWNVWR